MKTQSFSAGLEPQIFADKRDSIWRWRPGLIAAAVVVIVTSIPQIGLIVKRGSAWQGSYALIDFDELTYSAYLNALIQGRPRRNNPYLSRESEIGESHFSIQFLPAYAVALPARALGISTSTALIVLARLVAFVSALAVFWLLFQITNDEKLSAAGTLLVLLCGRFTSESPLVAQQYYSSFAFLRQFVPAVPFPLFFLFCGLVWRAFVDKSKLVAFAAGAILAVLIFSYFYLWTAAAAWLSCFAVLWLVARTDDRRAVTKSILIIASIVIVALVPFIYLLSHRAQIIDENQALTFSRAPDLFRVTEIISLAVVLILLVYMRRGRIDWKSHKVLFVTACAMTPFVVFNQQVITGRSLQAFHYEQFIINYLVLLSIVVMYSLLWSHLKIRPIVWAAFAIGIGLATAVKEARDHFELNVRRDQAKPIFEQLEASGTYGWVVFDNSLLAASAQTDSTVPQLWSPNMYFYGGVSDGERRERFFQYLCLLGVEPQTFDRDLQNSPQFQAAVFGLRRVNFLLTQTFTPISAEEMRAQVEAYSAFTKDFSEQQANRWPLTYVVTSNEVTHDFTTLDRWYTRSSGEPIGDSIVYRVGLKQR